MSTHNKLHWIIEGALMASGQPLTVKRLAELFDEEERPSNDDIKNALAEIAQSCESRGYELVEVASGWRFQVRDEYGDYINRLWEEKPAKYSRAMLETLALIAYRQPITRGDIEEIRGVAVSSNITRTLIERNWIRVVGHRDVPGRPALYATTKTFLDYFNLKNLDELPSLGEIRDVDELLPELDLQAPEQGEGSAVPEQEGESTQIQLQVASSDDEQPAEQINAEAVDDEVSQADETDEVLNEMSELADEQVEILVSDDAADEVDAEDSDELIRH